MQFLAADRGIVLQEADDGSLVVIWNKVDYLKEGKKQLRDKNFSRKVEKKRCRFNQLELATSFLRTLGLEDAYFSYEFKKISDLGELYLLPKIQKRLPDVPERPVISNCGTLTEKVSKFLDVYLKLIMKNGNS